MSTFAAIVEETQAIIAEAKKKAEEAFLKELKDVFVRHPEIKCFKWVQYTPYFNDGDACTFRVGDIYFSNTDEINYWGEFEGDEEPEDFICEGLYGTMTGEYEDLQGLSRFMNSGEGEDILEFMFGDHVQVTVTAEGVETDDYEHD